MIIESAETGIRIMPSSGMILTNGEIYFPADIAIEVPAAFDTSKIYEVFPANIPSEELIDNMGADFWESFYRTGRTDFSYGFVNAGAAYIVPPQPITAKLISYILMNCTNLLDASGITVNITADKPTCVSICMGCALMAKPPHIRFTGENAHVVRSYVCAFTNCIHLTEAVIWLGDGTQSASGERTDMANTFMNCNELQHLAFTGKGSPKNLDLSSCKKLTLASIETLESALMDVSEETAGTYEITISSETAALMPEELTTVFTVKGWTLNIKEETTE